MSANTTSSLAFTLSAIQLRMSPIAMSIFLVFGSSGNILNTMIFLQKTLRSSSCSMYMIAAYIFNTLLLWFAMSTTLYSLSYRDPLTYSEPYCKLRQYIVSAIFAMARFCVGMACVDRYAVSSQNVNIRAFGRPHIARRVIAIIIIMGLIIPVHMIILNIIQNGKCVMPGLYPYFFAAYAIIVAAIIPPSMMITFTILAAKHIRQIRRRVRPGPVATTTTENTGVRLKKYDYQLLKMLVVDVAIYCISIIPSPIYYIYAAVTLKSSKTVEQLAWQSFCNYLTYQILLYISASSSLYTNILVSKAFRIELRLFLNRYLLKRGQVIAAYSNNNTPNYPIRLRTITARDDAKPAKIQH